MSVRVHQLAKELKLTSKEVIDRLKVLKVDVKGHMSSVDDDVAERLKRSLAPEPPKATAVATAASPSKPSRVLKAIKTPKVSKAAKPSASAVVSQPSVTTSTATVVSPSVAVKVEPSMPPKPVAASPATKATAPPPIAEPVPPTPPAPSSAPAGKPLQLTLPVTVKDLSVKLGMGPSELIKRFMQEKLLVTINQSVSDQALVERIARERGFALEQAPTKEEALLAAHGAPQDLGLLTLRSPVVTLMGHVDHGKTSLLDTIRKTKVAEQEAGRITQHIGAYSVVMPKGRVTFLDTPGHEAFTAMRARGASVTDVVVLVVAADDGVMPQTVEAINHARAANVPIVVAINKSDLPSARPDVVKQQLAKHELMSEDWGGKTIMVLVSAKTGHGIDNLLEMLLLEAELLELKADPTRPARGIVIEGRLSPRGGPLATVIPQQGTLRQGDLVLCGPYWGRIRAMLDDHGHRVREAPPSMPVALLGLSGVPEAGEAFYVVPDERKAREIAEQRQTMTRDQRLAELRPGQRMTLEHLHEMIIAGEIKELPIILKADVQGSLEALDVSLQKINAKEVKLTIVHKGVGLINESDVMLAEVSGAIVLGFHVEVTPKAMQMAHDDQVDVRTYQIIYDLLADIRAALEGMLTPQEERVVLGRAEVRQIFKVSKAGTIAGCQVLKGKIARSNPARLVREGEVAFEGKLSSLKRFKDDVREVTEGMECGIGFEGFGDPRPGDLIESYEIRQTARRLA